MKIGIDARFMTHPQRGGFKAYTRSVIYSLAEVDTVNEYILYTDRPDARYWHLPSNFTVKAVQSPNAIIREQIALPRAMKEDGVDLAHFTCNTAPIASDIRTVVTIHDTIPLRDGRRFIGGQGIKQAMLGAYWRRVMPRAIQRARTIITCTQFVLDDLQSMFGLPTERFHIVPNETNPIFNLQASGTPPDAIAPGMQFVMAFASADGRKNHPASIMAHQAVMREFPELKLALVCSHPDVRTEIGRTAREGVLPLGPVSIDELIWLYRNARALIFPSFDEGFGLPPLEAMACGLPVIASNKGSLPEVTGGCAVIVDPAVPGSITDALRRMMVDEAFRQGLISKGVQHARKYSRANMGNQLVAAYTKSMPGEVRI